MRRGFGKWIIVGCTVGCVVATGGCGLTDGLETVRNEANRAREDIAADRDDLLVAAEAMPVGSTGRRRVEALAAERSTQEAAFARAIERLDSASAASAGDAAGTLQDGAALLAPLVPPGAQLPLILGAGFAASLWRAARLKKSAASIAEGLEKAMSADNGLKDGVRRNAATMRSVQTPTAQRIVDEVKRARPMIRLPL